MKDVVSLTLWVSLCFSSPLWAADSLKADSLEKEEHLLDGMSFTFQYQNAGAMDVSFADGNLTYNWQLARAEQEKLRDHGL